MSRAVHWAVVLGLAVVGGGGGCRESLDSEPIGATVDAPPSAQCLEAETYADLTSIETKIFQQSCAFTGCHNGNQGSDEGRMDLRAGMSHSVLVGVASDLDPTRMRVVAGQPAQSLLVLMLGHLPPASAVPPATAVPEPGTMPLDQPLLCTQKVAAIERWIAAGALDN